MRPRLVLTTLACALLAASTAHAQRQRGDESWGKTGVSYLQYRTDAVECAYRVGQDAPVEYALVDIIFATNIYMPGAEKDVDMPMREMVDAASPNPGRMSRPFREISSQLQEPLAKCLGERGYRRFRLTKDQTKELRSLSVGSKARQVYLWNLAVDPQVQQRQVARR
jgi:ribosomal protein S18 acetylase RimI-like enzyme